MNELKLPNPERTGKMYRFKIKSTSNDQYRVQFAYNAEPMVWSESYVAKASAQNCIASIKANAKTAPIVDLTIGKSANGYRFEIAKANNGEYFTRFKASNGETMVWSETYTQKHNAKNCAQSVKDNAATALTVDESTAKAA
jgi:uncharacterized protein